MGGSLHRRSGERSQLLKSNLNGGGEASNFLLVDARRRKKHDEESKKQSDEVGVGNQPAFMIGMGLMFLLATHALAAAF